MAAGGSQWWVANEAARKELALGHDVVLDSMTAYGVSSLYDTCPCDAPARPCKHILIVRRAELEAGGRVTWSDPELHHLYWAERMFGNVQPADFLRRQNAWRAGTEAAALTPIAINAAAAAQCDATAAMLRYSIAKSEDALARVNLVAGECSQIYSALFTLLANAHAFFAHNRFTATGRRVALGHPRAAGRDCGSPPPASQCAEGWRRCSCCGWRGRQRVEAASSATVGTWAGRGGQ